ncbi:hypothetical protein BH20ACT3_BH20ACT3_12400 [soil metagenome]
MDRHDPHDEEPTGSGESERPFTVQEVMILELKAAGASNEAAGAAADRSAKTVQRLLRRPEAGALLRELQAERLEQVVGEMGMAVVDAAKGVCCVRGGHVSSARLVG